jgi:hypothetical protein
MRERPILFSGPMICAIMRDWQPKTQTRRIVLPSQTEPHVPPLTMEPWLIDGVQETDNHGLPCWVGTHPDYPTGEKWFSCPYGGVGDRLWVRETFTIVPVTAYRASTGIQQIINPTDPDEAAIYRAEWDRSGPGVGWKPSIHMPRWASRITLEIVNVRVECLQDISEEDAKAEGVARGWYERDTLDGAEIVPTDYRSGFRAAWNDMHAKKGHGWDVNPFVWVIAFTRLEGVKP